VVVVSAVPYYINQINNSYVTMLAKDYPINAFYGYVTDGLFQNQAEVDAHAVQPGAEPGDIRFRDLNNDGVINDSDRTVIGNPNPSWFFSMNNNLSYKGFELSVFLQGVAGNKIYNANNIDNVGMAAAYNQTTDVLNRWRGEGTSYSMPRAVFGDEPELPCIRPLCRRRILLACEEHHSLLYLPETMVAEVADRECTPFPFL